MARYVLDTSAILASLKGEDGFEKVREILRSAELGEADVLIPFIALMEVEYQLRRELELRHVERWLNVVINWPVQVVESSQGWRHVAAAVKAPGRLSLADSWVASLALLNDAELVHKDQEFEAVPGLKDVRLPYDPPRGSSS